MKARFAQLRQVREQRGLTRRELCRVVGLDFDQLGALERGDVTGTTLSTVTKLAGVLGVSVRYSGRQAFCRNL